MKTLNIMSYPIDSANRTFSLPTLFQSIQEFDVIALETKLETDYLAKNKPYVDGEIEIDGKSDLDSCIYRVWLDERCLGCFYRSPVNNLWIAEPFYGGVVRSLYKTAFSARQVVIKASLKFFDS
jgi:hypothetical protein